TFSATCESASSALCPVLALLLLLLRVAVLTSGTASTTSVVGGPGRVPRGICVSSAWETSSLRASRAGEQALPLCAFRGCAPPGGLLNPLSESVAEIPTLSELIRDSDRMSESFRRPSGNRRLML